MLPVPLRHCVCLTFALLLAACASVHHPRPVAQTPDTIAASEAPTQPASQYTAEREAGEVAQMRAAPAPEAAPILTGTQVAADEKRMAFEGYVRIGHGRYQGSEEFVRREVTQQARSVGADRVLLYAPSQSTATESYWEALYYVRFRLAFGASFRDLHASEREALGGRSGVQIGAVLGGTPAARANLLAGDYVVAVNGEAIAGKSAFQDALRSNVGRSVTLTIVRNGETLPRVVRLGGSAGSASESP